MDKDAEHSIEFLRGIYELCERLAATGFVIVSVESSYECFGTWSLAIRHQRESTVFDWDAREGILTIKGRASKPDSQGGHGYHTLEQKHFDTSRGEDPMFYVESYLKVHA